MTIKPDKPMHRCAHSLMTGLEEVFHIQFVFQLQLYMLPSMQQSCISSQQAIEVIAYFMDILKSENHDLVVAATVTVSQLLDHWTTRGLKHLLISTELLLEIHHFMIPIKIIRHPHSPTMYVKSTLSKTLLGITQ